jgi:putative membrane protein
MEKDKSDFLAQERTQLASERTLLAAERTLSAWIRTGLTSLGGGFAILRLISFETLVHQKLADFVGEFLILWSIAIFLYSYLSYKKSVKQLEKATRKHYTQRGPFIIIMGLILVSVILLFISLK